LPPASEGTLEEPRVELHTRLVVLQGTQPEEALEKRKDTGIARDKKTGVPQAELLEAGYQLEVGTAAAAVAGEGTAAVAVGAPFLELGSGQAWVEDTDVKSQSSSGCTSGGHWFARQAAGVGAFPRVLTAGRL